ncbi:hypothetical protein BH10PLA2_BH10PLA2_22060 [soil metagenome]
MLAIDRQFDPTGVPGLYHPLMGSFLRDGFYLVQGDPDIGQDHSAATGLLPQRSRGAPPVRGDGSRLAHLCSACCVDGREDTFTHAVRCESSGVPQPRSAISRQRA